jgi:hypothetical protein
LCGIIGGVSGLGPNRVRAGTRIAFIWNSVHGEMEGHVKPPKHKRRKRRKRDAGVQLKRLQLDQRYPDKQLTVDEAPDGVRMSDVLEEFIAPFYPLAGEQKEFLTLLGIAVAAWNVALFPAQEREAQIQGLLQALDPEVREDTRAVIYDLVRRKEEHFARYRRAILDYEVTDTGAEYHLVVASTTDPLGTE